MRMFLLFCCLAFASHIFCQTTMHDFSVRDVHGKQHRLYENYLDSSKVVVIKFFFTTCPPCIANAPFWQQKYVQFGSGNNGVEFFSVTTITSDYDPKVLAFEATYNQTMKGISQDGGANIITGPFKDGVYGDWYGTPSFVVIAPDRTMRYPVFFNDLDGAINIAKTKKPLLPTTVNMNINKLGLDIPEGDIRFFLKPKGQDSPKLEITKNILGNYSFSYPSADFPEMTNPEIIMESDAPALSPKVTAYDLVLIQKHILGIEPFAEAYKKLASDANNDGKVTAFDLVVIKKVILALTTEFPNTPSYKSLPASIDLFPSFGNVVTPEFVIVKVGNVN